MQRCSACDAVLATEVGDPEDLYDDNYHSGESGLFADTDAPRFRQYLDRVDESRLDLIACHAHPPGRLLEVGCGRGDFLAAAATRGWAVTGVEPAAAAVAAARRRHDLDVRVGTLETTVLEEVYDVACAFHVVEHVPDVVGLLQGLRDSVRPGGLVVVETPNWRSVPRMRRRGEWMHIGHLQHITLFTPATLRDAISRAGLRVLTLRSPSWTGSPQSVDQATSDLALPELRPVLERMPRGAWRVISAVDRIYDSARLGVTLLAVCVRD